MQVLLAVTLAAAPLPGLSATRSTPPDGASEGKPTDGASEAKSASEVKSADGAGEATAASEVKSAGGAKSASEVKSAGEAKSASEVKSASAGKSADGASAGKSASEVKSADEGKAAEGAGGVTAVGGVKPVIVEEGPPEDPTRVRWGVDLPVIGVSAAIFLGSSLASRELRWAGCGMCDPGAINPLDRRVIGNVNDAARLVSDIGVYTAIAAPFVLDLGDALIQRSRDRPAWRRRHMPAWGKDAVVLFEALAVDMALTSVVKLAVRRPRPYSYDADSTVGDPTLDEARLSFFSVHASIAFTMATSYAVLFQTRHPRSRWVAPVWTIGMSLASVTAVARVEAGKHFWSDVIVGAAVGTSIGLLVTMLHRNTRPGAPRLAFAPTRGGPMMVVSGSF